MANDSPLLSVIMIVKNEEKDLPLCLESVRGLANEIVVVDTGSTDRTVEMAQSLGARVVSHAWRDDFSEARNRSIGEATGRWLLWLDADDRVPDIEHGKIRRLVQGEDAVHLFIIENLYEGRKAQEFRQIRLFPRRPDLRFEGRIHETLSISAARTGLPSRVSDIRITHTGYSHAGKRHEKVMRNIALLEEEYQKYRRNPAVLMELGHAHYQLKDYDRAIQLYLEITTIPDAEQIQRDVYRSVPVFLGTAYYETGRREEARKWFKESLARFPEKIAAYYYLGKIALEEKDVRTVEAMFELVIRKEPDISTVASDYTGMKANAYAYIANLHFVRGEYQEALVLYAESEEKLGFAAYKYSTAAYAACKVQNLSKAVYFFAKAEGLNELTPDERSDFGVLLWGIARRDRAVMKWEEALLENPRCISAQNNYIDAIVELKEFKRGADFLGRLLEKEGASVELKFFRANLLKFAGDMEGAVNEAKAILEIDPDNAGVKEFLNSFIPHG